MKKVRTKQPQVVNAQRNISKQVYFEVKDYLYKKDEDKFIFEVVQYFLDSKQVLNQNNEPITQEFKVLLDSSPVSYKGSTFRLLFGDLTFKQFEEQIPQNLINQMAYVNALPFVEGNPRYWSLGVDDFEIVE